MSFSDNFTVFVMLVIFSAFSVKSQWIWMCPPYESELIVKSKVSDSECFCETLVDFVEFLEKISRFMYFCKMPMNFDELVSCTM